MGGGGLILFLYLLCFGVVGGTVLIAAILYGYGRMVERRRRSALPNGQG